MARGPTEPAEQQDMDRLRYEIERTNRLLEMILEVMKKHGLRKELSDG